MNYLEQRAVLHCVNGTPTMNYLEQKAVLHCVNGTPTMNYLEQTGVLQHTEHELSSTDCSILSSVLFSQELKSGLHYSQ
jgi:hypothetical protein